MTEQELIEKQRQSDNGATYLMKVGMFFHAYEAGAFALARATGYRIKRKPRKGGREVLVAGFPAESLDTVISKLEVAGATVTRHNDTFVEIAGLDGTPDEEMVDAGTVTPQSSLKVDAEWKRKILSYDLFASTPLEAMNFLSVIQNELRGLKQIKIIEK